VHVAKKLYLMEENGKFVFEGEQIAIDDKNDVQYESLCGDCYYKYTEK